MQNENKSLVPFFFVLHSIRPLNKIRQECYVFTSENKLWLHKSPGTIQLMVMLSTVMLDFGFITNVLQEEILHSVAMMKIQYTMTKNIILATSDSPANFESPTKINLTQDAKLDTHLDCTTTCNEYTTTDQTPPTTHEICNIAATTVFSPLKQSTTIDLF